MNTQLFIIGNGFDIYHGIKSKYSDFEIYVKTVNPNLYESLKEYFVQDELWSDFENTLAQLDTDKMVENAAQYLDDYGVDDWSDAGHHNYQYELQKAIDLVTEDLLMTFLKWILQLDIPKNINLNLPKNSKYLVFNYTRTLQQNYQIPVDNIIYIHNEAIDENSKIILGHGREITADMSFSNYNEDEDMESYDVRVMEGNRILDSYFKETFKDTKSIIEDNEEYFLELRDIEEIVILGHSLSDIDLPYFEKILNCVKPSTLWIVSYYIDKNKPVDILESIGVSQEQISTIRISDLYM